MTERKKKYEGKWRKGRMKGALKGAAGLERRASGVWSGKFYSKDKMWGGRGRPTYMAPVW